MSQTSVYCHNESCRRRNQKTGRCELDDLSLRSLGTNDGHLLVCNDYIYIPCPDCQPKETENGTT